MNIIYTTSSKEFFPSAINMMNSIKPNIDEDIDLVVFVIRTDKIDIDFKDNRIKIRYVDNENLDNYESTIKEYGFVGSIAILKISIAEKLLAEYDSVIYFDSDYRIYNKLDWLFKNIKSNNISMILTPHCYTPRLFTRFPTDFDILNSGFYNAGFFAVNKQGVKAIQWWKEMCRKHAHLGVAYPKQFAEQKWLTHIPLYFSGVISAPVEYGVAYYNIDDYKDFDMSKLVSIHFTGREVGSKYLSIHSTRLVSSYPKFKKLYENYK